MTSLTITGSSNDTNLVLSSPSSTILDGDPSSNGSVAPTAAVAAVAPTAAVAAVAAVAPTAAVAAVAKPFVNTSPHVYPPELDTNSDKITAKYLKGDETNGVIEFDLTRDNFIQVENYFNITLENNVVQNIGGRSATTNTVGVATPINSYVGLWVDDPSHAKWADVSAVSLENNRLVRGLLSPLDPTFNGSFTQWQGSGLAHNTAEFVPGSGNCNGHAFTTFFLLFSAGGSPLSWAQMTILNDSFAAPPLLPGSFAGGLAGGGHMLDASGLTWSDKLLEWAGVFDGSGAVVFSNLSNNPFAKEKVKYHLCMNRLFKIERAMQYGLIKLDANYVAELFKSSGSMPIAGLDLSAHGFELKGFPSLDEINTILNSAIIAALDISGINNTSDLAATGVSYPSLSASDFTWTSDPASSLVYEMTGARRLYLLHIIDIFLMAKPSSFTSAQINTLKNLTIPFHDLNGTFTNKVIGFDPTFLTDLPPVLKDVPVFESLWSSMKNTNVLFNYEDLGNTNVSVAEHQIGHVILNMYAILYQNLLDNTADSENALYTIEEFEAITVLSCFISRLGLMNGAYRTGSEFYGGQFAAPILNADANSSLLEHSCKPITATLLKEFSTRTGNPNYKMYQPFSSYLSGLVSALDTMVYLPPTSSCPC